MTAFFPKQPASRLSTVQQIAAATTSTGATNAFGSQTFQVRLATTALVFFRVGDGTQTAATTDSILPPNCVDYVTVTPGQKIAAITSSGTATVSVTEMA